MNKARTPFILLLAAAELPACTTTPPPAPQVPPVAHSGFHDQPWGAQATAALARHLSGQQLELEVETQDRYERLVAIVYLHGENLNAWLVKQGHAWAYRDYLKEASYCVWESDARQARLGLWNAAPASSHAPWEWRRVA